MKKKVMQFFVLFLVFVVLLGVLHLLRFGGLTGFTILTDSTLANFDSGSYNDTSYNGTGVVLNTGKTMGNFTSQVFDAGADATWNNVSFFGTTPNVEFLYSVDSLKAVYSSVNSGATWTTRTSDYGDGIDIQNMISDFNYLYIIFSGGKIIYRSSNNGVSWSAVNSTLGTHTTGNWMASASDSNNVLYIIDGAQKIWKSDNSGVTWTSGADFNGATSNDVKGITVNSSNDIYAVDGAKGVYSSSNQGTSWTQKTSDYGGTTGTDGMTSDGIGNLYILLDKGIYKSTNSGTTWSVINSSFTPYSQDGAYIISDESSNLYILDVDGRAFKSANSGVLWSEVGDINGGVSNDPKGFTNYLKATNLTYQVRNCSLSGCGDGTFRGSDGTANTYYASTGSLNLTGRYFQYKFFFETPDSSKTPTLESVNVDYTLINTAPSLNLLLPSSGDAYGYNTGIALNYTSSDADGNLDSCWYNVNNGANTTIALCGNTTFSVAGSGSYNLNLFANDTQGEGTSDSVSFSVSLGAPAISLSSPSNGTYLNSGNTNFVYTATDLDLSYCELWGDFDGTFKLNQTDNGVSSGVQRTLNLNLTDGEYLWNVRCQDSAGNSAFNGNKTFFVDTTNPRITVSEPTGTKSSRIGIPLTFILTEANQGSCIYNVYQGASVAVANTSISCSSGSGSFDVSVDADFVLNFYVNDSAGNSNLTSRSFSVSTSSGGSSGASSGGSSSGGGGSGGGFVTYSNSSKRQISLNFEGTDSIILKRGTKDNLDLEVRSREGVFLNKCFVKAEGDKAGWVLNRQVEGLSPGEKFVYNLEIAVPDDSEPGNYLIPVGIQCDEGSALKDVEVTVYRNNFEARVLNYEKIDNVLKVNYLLEEFSNKDHNIVLQYQFLDFDDVIRTQGQKEIVLAAGYSGEQVLEFNLPKDSFGEFRLKLILEDGSVKSETIDEIFLPSRLGVTGLFASETGRQTLSLIGIIVISLIFAFFIVRFGYRRYKRNNNGVENSLGKRMKRRILHLDLKEM